MSPENKIPVDLTTYTPPHPANMKKTYGLVLKEQRERVRPVQMDLTGK